jgi:hypothetical protein
LCHNRTHAPQQKGSLNHLVGASKQYQWNFDAERPGGSQINDEVELLAV